MKKFIQRHLGKKMAILVVIIGVLIGASWWLVRSIPAGEHAASDATREAQAADQSHHLSSSQDKPAADTPQKDAPPVVPNYTIPPAVNGMAPVIARIPTDLPVVYLGIDDGANKTQAEIDLLAQNHIKASLFLSDLFIASDPGFFKPIIAQGSIVENHTLSHHTRMVSEPYAFQKQEICGMADKIQQYYGRRPTLFRPPGGAYSDSLRKAAHECGMKAVITWIAKANGGSMQYQVGTALRPGDVVLMHFRPEFEQDLNAFVAAMKASGLHTELLETLPGAQ